MLHNPAELHSTGTAGAAVPTWPVPPAARGRGRPAPHGLDRLHRDRGYVFHQSHFFLLERLGVGHAAQ